MPASGSSLNLLGTPLQLTTHADWFARCRQLAIEQRVTAVEFTNTQIVTMRRHEPWFRGVTGSFDYFVPDATPLLWCLNWHGARLVDRVYGPAFFKHCLLHSPGGLRHYFIGGSEQCGLELRRLFQIANPSLQIVGSFHGRVDSNGRILEGDRALIDEINRLSPDFIWVGLGAPKQENWVHHYKTGIGRGVILSVGQAFDVNAGLRRDAPAWMQRIGLTWLFRLISEPRRLIGRYVRYNSLFLFYAVWDGLCGRLCRDLAETEAKSR
ncbi:MAG: WecB/TagA/CpsF family glycosyltransferase [Opitutaceae bacterium]|nr:WecB/TagA/CpsF family glycosyltransferase [Verrucomicrobiales bacterium]